jgi:hypothetical protein
MSECQTCQSWVAYNQPNETASRGECLLPMQENSPIEISLPNQADEGKALVTAFDFGCNSFQEKTEAPSDTSSAPS